MASLKTLKARHVMTGPVETIQADWSLKEAARFLMDHHFSGAPVVEPDGRPVGVLTIKDIARYAEWHLEAEERDDTMRELRVVGGEGPEARTKDIHLDRLNDATVRAVMTPRIRTVIENAPLKEVLDALAEGPFHRIFVRDRKGEIEGVVSALDIVRVVARTLGPARKRAASRAR